MSSAAPSLLLLGATGAVGRHVLALALADARIGQVIAPTRRPLAPQPKLVNPVTDFSDTGAAAAWPAAGLVVCALGSTIKAAGSRAAFAAVDHDLPLALARVAQAAGASRFALVSALGAQSRSNFYLRTKARTEEDLGGLGFARFVVLRPSLIDAERSQPRTGEQLGLAIARLLGRLVPARYRPVRAETIARRLLEEVLDPAPGQRVIESEAIADAGNRHGA